MPLPTFLILGAQKCGTTSLTAMLRRHPEIRMSRPKELHYFDRQRHDLAWYASQFQPEPHHTAWGEATPSYIFLDSARRRVARDLPDARFIVMLRDPAKRAHSHFWHNHRLGVETTTNFEEALDLEPERTARGATRLTLKHFAYVGRSRYVEQLTAMEELVGRDRIHVALLDDLVTERVATLHAILEFLGVDASVAAAIPEVHKVPKRGHESVADSYEPMAPATRERLINELTPSVRGLEKWLGRDLTPWLTV